MSNLRDELEVPAPPGVMAEFRGSWAASALRKALAVEIEREHEELIRAAMVSQDAAVRERVTRWQELTRFHQVLEPRREAEDEYD